MLNRPILMESRMSSNVGHLDSKTRSIGQIKEILCGRSRGHISCSIDRKIGENVCLHEISYSFGFEIPRVKY